MKTRPLATIPPTVLVLALFSLALIPCAWAQEAAQPASVSLEHVGSADLLWKSRDGLVPLPVVDVEVELRVTGVIVLGHIEQRFRNPTDEVIEALYVFPLPDRAAVHRMEMRIGDRRIVSDIREKEQAKREYDRARETGRKASLVDQMRPNLFSSAVANVNPGETVRVVLEYYDEVDYEDGRFGLRFPMTFTPRFTPATPGLPDSPETGLTASTASRPLQPLVRLSVSLRPGFPIERIESPSHGLEFHAAGDALLLNTSPAAVVADRDFLLEWVPQRGSEPLLAAFVERRGDARYALVLVVPPSPGGDIGVGLATETLFVVDVSGSMAGPSIEQARAALTAALARLRPDDRFALLAFNDEPRVFRPEPVAADEESLRSARAWVDGLAAGGGTMIYPALMRGLEMLGESSSAHAQRIVFLTDGAVSNEQELLRALSERLGDVRLHAIGIGQAPNTYLMRKMASLGHGECLFVSDAARAPGRMSEFLERLDRPVVQDVTLDTAGAGLEEVEPSVLPDLYAGAPLVLSARLTDRGSRMLEVGGYARTGWSRFSVDLSGSVPEGAGVAVRWARRRVGSLMDRLHEGADAGDVRDQVVRLGLDFHLVTAYTSLVAVEDAPSAAGQAHPTRLAAALPAGGTDNPLERAVGVALLLVGLLLLAGSRVWVRYRP